MKSSPWNNVMILDCPEIECPPVLVRVFLEFCGAFRRRNIPVSIARNIHDITDQSIVFMGDFFNVPTPAEILAHQSVRALYVGWYWQKQNVLGLPYFIHIYENVLSDTLLPDKVEMMKFMSIRRNTCPLLLRADEAPEKIGSYARSHVYDFCFMGGRMCEHLVPKQPFNGFYHGTHFVSEYMTYEERRKVYLSSTFALGFQTGDNIHNGHVSQRIFEGLSYGCIVISNSIHASLQTEGIVVCATTREEIEERMRHFLYHPEEMKEKQQAGYDFARRLGTNDLSLATLDNTIFRTYGFHLLNER